MDEVTTIGWDFSEAMFFRVTGSMRVVKRLCVSGPRRG